MPTDQLRLFEPGEWWEDLWQGMPEFVQLDLTPVKSILVHFDSFDDYETFGKTIGQKLGRSTRSTWFPPAEIGRYANKRYVDGGAR